MIHVGMTSIGDELAGSALISSTISSMHGRWSQFVERPSGRRVSVATGPSNSASFKPQVNGGFESSEIAEKYLAKISHNARQMNDSRPSFPWIASLNWPAVSAGWCEANDGLVGIPNA
jgi:hypothetical protein